MHAVCTMHLISLISRPAYNSRSHYTEIRVWLFESVKFDIITCPSKRLPIHSLRSGDRVNGVALLH